ncbi:hypothetical protein CTI14_69280, partial [Methylobacterium radiotolerans]
DRDPVADRVGELAERLISSCRAESSFEGALGQRADEDLQELRVDDRDPVADRVGELAERLISSCRAESSFEGALGQ